jgi:phosphatidylglycerol:prolipoprotein diacylglycerol transferase
MHPLLFKIGVFSVHSYGLMMALAFLSGIGLSLYFAGRGGIKKEAILDLAILVIIFGIAGARLSYVIGQWDKYKGDLVEILMVQQGGLAFLGGFLAALLVTAAYAKIKKIPILKLFDVLAPGVALGYAIARIGCFLNGCCFGVAANVPWAIKFPPGSLPYYYCPEEAIHPTQLYASFSMFIAFLVILYLWRKRKFDGQIFFWFLILYSTYRFVVEFFRYCPPDLFWLGLRPGQIVALIMFVIGLAGLLKKGAGLNSANA